MVVFFPAMIQGINTDAKSQAYHKDFERLVFDNIEAKNGKTG